MQSDGLTAPGGKKCIAFNSGRGSGVRVGVFTLLVQTIHFWYKQYTFGTNRTLLVQTVGSQAYNVRMSETQIPTWNDP